jgi:hypothetical protein
MKTSIAAAAIVYAALIAPAHADWETKSGYWINHFYSKNSQGSPMCTATVYGEGRSFAIKSDGQDLWVHITKVGWNFRTGIKTKILMQVDDAPGLRMTAETVPSSNGTGMLEATFNLEQKSEISDKNMTQEFLEFMQTGNKLVISFPGGTENDWVANLNGSNTSISRLMHCIQNSIGGGTSPVDKSQTSPVDKDM